MPGTVLVADDEPLIRSLVKNALERQGYRVLEARDGQEALGICERLGPSIDLLLTDIVMPVMDGIQLSERVSSILPNVRVLYMSGQCEIDVVQHHIRDKGFGFLRKPFALDVLAERIRKLVEAPVHKKGPQREDPPASSVIGGRSA
jgi:DNA-binding NtrC family response regulator